MEQLSFRLQQLHQALKTFNEALLEFKQDGRIIIRDGCIQRFEYCYELFWKVLKIMLETNHNVFTASPRSTLQEAQKAGIISPSEFAELLALIVLRNATTHTYDEATADKVTLQLPSCYKIMYSIALRLKEPAC